MSTSHAVSAIVVTYRTGPVLRDCLAALMKESEVGEIIVVDNGNPPADEQWLDSLAVSAPNLLLLRPGRNIGFSRACNLAAAKAGSRFLALVNPDLVISSGAFERLLPIFEADPSVSLCGGKLVDEHGQEQRGSRRETLTPWRALVELLRLDRLAPSHPYFRRFHLLDEPSAAETMEVPAISGAFMMLPRERYLALGGLDESMFLHAEDLDLCLRILLAGGRIVYCGALPFYHQRSTSDVSVIFVEWHKTRSTCRYFHKHFRHAYPTWCLRGIELLLWVRFIVTILPRLPADLARMIGRAAPP